VDLKLTNHHLSPCFMRKGDTTWVFHKKTRYALDFVLFYFYEKCIFLFNLGFIFIFNYLLLNRRTASGVRGSLSMWELDLS